MNSHSIMDDLLSTLKSYFKKPSKLAIFNDFIRTNGELFEKNSIYQC